MTEFGVSPEDLAIMTKQLGREPRGALKVSYRTPDGIPAVVMTKPKLDDGTPFPTLYYLTDPRLTAEASRLEVAGIMKSMTKRLAEDADLAADYRAAHEHYLAERNAIEDLGTDFSGGGMPDRVKCLHVLLAYALSEGPDRVRLGTEAVALAAENNPKLRGTAIPADWPTPQELGTSMAAASVPAKAASTRTLAAVDCGTNSIRLLISEVGADGAVTREIMRLNTIVRLGEGVDATGRFSDAAVERVRVALTRYVELMEQHGVSAVRMVATSATRDAANREEFFAMTSELLGRIQPGACAEVIEGTEEARLSFIGAIADIPGDDTFCVVDLGGGSTEFVVGRRGEVLGSISTRMGCVRLTERCLHSDPPTAEEIATARAVVAEQIELVKAAVPVEKTAVLVGCAGTFTTLSALVQGLPDYLPEKIHMSKLSSDSLVEMTNTLLAETVAQRSARPQILAGRADVIGGGCVVVQAIAELFRSQAGIDEFVISEKDILDGMVAELAAQ